MRATKQKHVFVSVLLLGVFGIVLFVPAAAQATTCWDQNPATTYAGLANLTDRTSITGESLTGGVLLIAATVNEQTAYYSYWLPDDTWIPLGARDAAGNYIVPAGGPITADQLREVDEVHAPRLGWRCGPDS